MQAQIDVLLATYNGQLYIAEQLDSLLEQTVDSWRLVVRDDGSRDDTLAIVQTYADRHPGKVEVITDDRGNLGPCGSYSVLLQNSRAPYVAFCDQDDVWLPEKLEIQLRAMREAEARLPENSPVLVHTDMIVADADISKVSDSFWSFQNMSPQNMATLQRLLIQNHVTACATLINRSLADLASPVPAVAKMHDWWLALVACIWGDIVWVQVPTLLYRQHGANDIGAKKWGFRYFVNVLAAGGDALRSDLLATRDQARALLALPALGPEVETTVQRYVDLYEMNWFKKRYCMMRYGYLKYGLIRNIGLFLFA